MLNNRRFTMIWVGFKWTPLPCSHYTGAFLGYLNLVVEVQEPLKGLLHIEFELPA
jgi:hypothetical protein